MGADIHSFAEVRDTNDKWQRVEEQIFSDYGTTKSSEPFGNRDYSVFGFLADVRNYSYSPVLAEPKGLPDDSEWLLNQPHEYDYENNPISGELIPISQRETNRSYVSDGGYHSHSWFTLKELLDYNYDQLFENRRTSVTIYNEHGGSYTNGAADAGEGNGTWTTMREHLGDSYFEDIEVLKSLGTPDNVRIVFWFDN